MARGRMIAKCLSTSERFASLHQEAGSLAEFCQSLYPLLLAHADDWGCLQGDVFTVKHLVHPTSPRKLPDFERALKALHNVRLITWYQVDEKYYIAIRGWSAHQQLKGHDKDGRKRTFPEPPQNTNTFSSSAQIRPFAPKPALREEKRTEENLRRTVADATAEVADPDLDTGHVTNGSVGVFLKRFCELYSQHRHGAKYFVKRARDVPTVKLLLGTYEPSRLEKLAHVLLTTDDDWVDHTDRGIGILSVKAAWLDGLLAEYEAEHGVIGVG